jgi:NADH-quinone oxidoreductase subunit L
MFVNEIVAHLTWASPFIGSLAILVLTALRKNALRGYFAVITLFLSAVSSTVLLSIALNSPGFLEISYPWVPTLNVDVGIFVDTLSAFMAIIVTWLCALIGLYSLKYMNGDSGLTRYWFFFTFFTGSMLLIVMANNLLLMFIGWEGTGLASYALIGHWYTDEKEKWIGDPDRKAWGTSMGFSPSHSGIRALVFTRLGDVGLIVGIAILYMLTNSLNIQTIADTAGVWGGGLVARGILLPFLLIFSLGALAKSAQFPFHEWLVTAMTGPTSVSALIHAATMVKAGVFFMLRFTPIFLIISRELTLIFPSVASEINVYFIIIAFIGAFTAFLMATQGIVARELKLVLAFSTASQLGYMFLAVGAAGLVADFVNGFIATFSHLMSHAIFKASLFLAAGAVIHTVESMSMSDMGGLRKIMKITFAATLIAALSLSGLPPLMGFWTKDLILETAYEAQLVVPFILAVVTAAITAFYAMRFIMKTFVVPPSDRIKHMLKKHELHEAHRVMLTPYTLLAVATLGIGLGWMFIGGNFYGALTKNVLAIEEGLALNVELNPFLTGLSVGMVLLGLAVAYIMYAKTEVSKSITKRVETNWGLRGIHNFLYNRWYINSLYYGISVRGIGTLSRLLNNLVTKVIDGFYHKLIPWFITKMYGNGFKVFETGIIDGFYHRLLPWFTGKVYREGFKAFETGVIDKLYHSAIVKAFTALIYGTSKYFEKAIIDHGYNFFAAKIALGISNVFRKIQTGKINHYLLIFLFGFVILVLLFMLEVI